MSDDPTVIPRTELEAEPIKDRAEELTPSRYLNVTLTEEVRAELETWLHDHLIQIESEMAGVLARWERERNQLLGQMPGADHPYAGAFRVNYPITRRKVREVSNRRKQAYLDSDPIWAVGTDPERPDLLAEAQDVEAGLDTAVDHELEAEDDLSQAEFESTLHGTGLLEPGWEYLEDVRRDVEFYAGFDGKTLQSLADLARFEQAYPNWHTEPVARKLHAQLARGRDVHVEVSYVTQTRNSPHLRFIPLASSRVYPAVEGGSGLRTTPVYGYVREYTKAELTDCLQAEVIDQDGYDRMLQQQGATGETARDEMERFEVFHATIRYQLPGDDRVVRYKVWQERESKAVLRIRGYPWWYNQPDLIPFYIRQEEPGFYKPGLAEDLKDDHVVLNVILNMFLNGADLVHSMKFKVKQKSPAEQHLLRGLWSPRLPMPYKDNPNEVEPMPMSAASLAPLVTGFELMRRQSDESTGTSSLQSGRESPTDPGAPGNKTAMLLMQVEPNLKEYIRSMQPGMREAGRWVLWLYYQGVSLGWIDHFPGLPDLPRERLPELAEHLNPRALLFESDRQGRQQRNLALLEIVTKVYAQRPEIIGEVMKVVLSQWDSEWARRAKSLNLEVMPPPSPTPEAGGGGLPNLHAVTSRLGSVAQGNGAPQPLLMR